MNKINKILIANRGEIAVRIIKSAKKMGIPCVVVYARPDQDALAVQLADESALLQGSDLASTYLDIDQIIDIAKKHWCDAIHPGYGFLAENPLLVDACQKNNITFIGPDKRSIQLMGNKIESRKFVKELGIPLTEGITGKPDELVANAKKIPLPLLVKAAAGGGGKGMRIVRSYEELPQILESTAREAKTYFGDESIYIEQYIEEPRHIEIQVLGDSYGNAIHLNERECSIQRRYQKIIEESPSPGIDAETRSKMGEAAVKICKEIGYQNAGTIEFLLDKNRKFYFLEMNTRIQVEHPVTEMITGIDLVEEQIKIAGGEKLAYQQSDIHINGHAIECRIYAEDPANNFLPSPGDISYYKAPSIPEIRIDAALNKATTVHSFYDPMISKVISHGENRTLARQKMIAALNDYIIHGIESNIPYLISVLEHPHFENNHISTNFCNQLTDELLQINKTKSEAANKDLFAIALLLLNPVKERNNIWQNIGYWRMIMHPKVDIDGEEISVEMEERRGANTRFLIHNNEYLTEINNVTAHQLDITINKERHLFYISEGNKGKIIIEHNKSTFTCERMDYLNTHQEYDVNLNESGDGKICSPMPGKVIKMHVNEGQTVEKNDILLVVEAMKMENNILAPRQGIVSAIKIKEGDMVDKDFELITLQTIEEN